MVIIKTTDPDGYQGLFFYGDLWHRTLCGAILFGA